MVEGKKGEISCGGDVREVAKYSHFKSIIRSGTSGNVHQSFKMLAPEGEIDFPFDNKYRDDSDANTSRQQSVFTTYPGDRDTSSVPLFVRDETTNTQYKEYCIEGTRPEIVTTDFILWTVLEKRCWRMEDAEGDVGVG